MTHLSGDAPDLAPAAPGERRRDKARLDAMIQSALDCIIAMDAEGRVIEFNPAAERTFGYSRAEAVGRPLADLIIPERLRRAHWRGLRRFLDTGEGPMIGRRVEMPALRKDGTELTTELAISVTHADGEPPIFTAYLRDVSEAAAAHDSLSLLAAAGAVLGASLDYETTLDALARLVVPGLADWCAVDLVEPDGAVRRLSVVHRDPEKMALADQLARRFPAPDGKPLRGPRAVIATGEAEHAPEIDDEILSSSALGAEHLRILRSLGLRSYMCVPLKARGRVLGALTLVTAESGRRYGARDLELARELGARAAVAVDNAALFRAAGESERRFRVMADASPVMIWVADTTSACTWFNRRWLDFRGRTLEQELDNGWADGVHSDDQRACLRTYRAAFDARRQFRMRYRLRRADGGYAWVLDQGAPNFDGRDFAGYIGSCVDITDSVESEAKLERYARELEARAAEMARFGADLEDFTSIAAHDLMEPLRGISLRLDMLEEDVGHLPAGAEHVRGAKRLALRMVELLDAVLRYTRAMRDAPSMVPSELRALAEEAVERLGESLRVSGARVSIDPRLPRVPCDPAMVRHVLANLISNGIKFNRSDPPLVEVGCVRGSDPPAISVRDNGIGIPAGQLSSAFRMFKRLHGRDEYGGGIGAGLSIAKRMVESHGGRLWVESRPGEGTTVYFTLAPDQPAGMKREGVEEDEVKSIP